MKKTHILLIDDEVDILNSFSTILTELGFKVDTCKNFDAAVKFLEKTTPDLVISDLNTNSKINGIEFYMQTVMKTKLPFALHTGSLDPTSRDMFVQTFLENFQIEKAERLVDHPEAVHLTIRDKKTTKSLSRFPCFCKPTLPQTILQYFGFEV